MGQSLQQEISENSIITIIVLAAVTLVNFAEYILSRSDILLRSLLGRIGTAARIQQNLIEIAYSFIQKLPGALARRPPPFPLKLGGTPADHAYFFNIRVNFSKNHSAPSSMRAEREYVDTFRLDIGTMQRSPNGNCRFKCSESFSVVGGCHSQALSRNTGTDQIVRRHLGITLRVLIPAAGRLPTRRDDIKVAAAPEFIHGSPQTTAPNPA